MCQLFLSPSVGSEPKLSNGREQAFHHGHVSKEAILELAVENALFPRNMRSIH